MLTLNQRFYFIYFLLFLRFFLNVFTNEKGEEMETENTRRQGSDLGPHALESDTMPSPGPPLCFLVLSQPLVENTFYHSACLILSL